MGKACEKLRVSVIQIIYSLVTLFFLASCQDDEQTDTIVERVLETKELRNKSDIVPLSVEVYPVNAVIPIGTTIPITVRGIYPYDKALNLSDLAVFNISDDNIVRLDQLKNNFINAVEMGSTKISANHRGIEGFTKITVTDAELKSLTIIPDKVSLILSQNKEKIIPEEVDFKVLANFNDGSSQNYTQLIRIAADEKSFTYTPEYPSRILVNNEVNKKITIRFNDIKKDVPVSATIREIKLDSISLSEENMGFNKGLLNIIEVTGNFNNNTSDDITADVSFSELTKIGRPPILSINDNNQIICLKKGITEIVVSSNTEDFKQKFRVTCFDKILKNITIKPGDDVIPKGITRIYQAIGEYTDGTEIDISSSVQFRSENSAIAQVFETRVTPISTGYTQLTATLNNVTGTTNITVTNAKLEGLNITAKRKFLAKGLKDSLLKAEGTFSDNTTQDLTDNVTWSSDKLAFPNIDESTGHTIVHAKREGLTTIKAKYLGKETSIDFEVLPASLIKIEIEPQNSSKPLGEADGNYTGMKAYGTYTDGDRRNITQKVTWYSGTTTPTTPTIPAYVSNHPSNKGRIFTIAEGSLDITATYEDIEVTTQFTVNEKAVYQFNLNAPQTDFDVGQSSQFTAEVTYTDGSIDDVTYGTGKLTIAWSSQDESIAGVNEGNVTGVNEGNVTALTEGAASIHATLTDNTTNKTFTKRVNVKSHTPCDATTGTRIGFYCWYVSEVGQNCEQTCINASRTYHLATQTYGGSSGNNTQCRALAENLFGIDYVNTPPEVVDTKGVGCAIFEDPTEQVAQALRFQTATTANDSLENIKRICACE